MPILKTVRAPNGALATHHKLLIVEGHIDQQPDALMVRIAAYASEEDMLLGVVACHWPPARITLDLLSCEDFVASIERVLVSAVDSPLLGGDLIAPVTDLETARARRWAEMKGLRSAHEYGPLLFDGSVFDADAESRSRILAAATEAMLVVASGQQVSRQWTLSDNTIRTLNAEQLVALGRALAHQIDASHETGRVLRLQIYAAATAAEVNAIGWPDDWLDVQTPAPTPESVGEGGSIE